SGAGPRAGRRRRGARLVAGAAPSVRAVPGARDVSPGAAAFGYTLRAVGARLALALPLVMLATALAVRAHPANRVEGFDTAGWWLHLPTLLLAGLAVTATVDAWPAFGRDRAPAAQITRLRIGALDGCGAAALAGLCGLAPALLLAGVGFAWSEGRA